MVRVRRSGARWIALLLGVTLVASAVVAYALVRVTAPSPGGDEAVSSTVVSAPATTQSEPVSRADVKVRSSTTAGATSPTPTTPATPASAASGPTSGTPIASAASSGAVASSDAAPTVTSVLQGSGVTLPAAWSGTAKVTVTVLGDCATKNPSVYTDAPAALALDLAQNEATAVATTVSPSIPDDEPTLTLGVNASQVPSLAVYSSAVDENGMFHRYWSLALVPGPDRTDIYGTLIDETVDAANPNILVDAETSLQPCEDTGTVAPPRVLAVGSTITGWVSTTSARLTLRATTTDGKREVTVEVAATRNQ